jgi:hypothetical protein
MAGATQPRPAPPRHGSNRASEDTVRQIKLKLLHFMRVDTTDDTMTGNFFTDFHIGSSWFDDALTVSPRPNAWTGQ